MIKFNWKKYLLMTLFTTLLGVVLIMLEVTDISMIFYSALFNIFFSIQKR